MTERWYCRIDRQVKGPLDFQRLQSLAAEGTLGPEDEVRTNREHVWRKAESIPELLFSEKVDANDLSAMLKEELLDPSLERHRETIDTCYCRVLGMELGPMPFSQLVERADNGELSPEDEVRLEDDAEWIPAGTVAGLFKTSAKPVHENVSSRAEAGVGADYGDFELQSGTLSDSTPEQDAQDGDAPGQIWYWQVAGREMGPFTFEEVVELARTGRLARTDNLRCGRSGEWTAAAAAFGGLFPKDKANGVDDDPTDESDDEFRYEDFVADAAAQQKKRDAAKARRRKSGRRKTTSGSSSPKAKAAAPKPEAPSKKTAPKDAVPEPVVTRPDPKPETPPPAPAAPSPPPRPAYVPPSRPAYVPPRPSRSGSSLDWDDLKEKAKYPAIAVVVLLIGFGAWHFGMPSLSFGGVSYSQNFGGGGGQYDDIIAIWSEANARHQPDFGTPEAWNEFKQRSLPRIKEIGDALEKQGASDDRSKVLLRCCRDYLPAILNAGPTKTPKAWDEMRKSLETLES